jgi:hypothetical protein
VTSGKSINLGAGGNWKWRAGVVPNGPALESLMASREGQWVELTYSNCVMTPKARSLPERSTRSGTIDEAGGRDADGRHLPLVYYAG